MMYGSYLPEKHAATISVEEVLEILYSYYLIHRVHKNIDPICTDYKFIVIDKKYQETQIIPTFYQLTFRLERQENDTHVVYCSFTPVKLQKEEEAALLKNVKYAQSHPRNKKETNHAYIADFLIQIITSYSDIFDYNVVGDQHRIEVREKEKPINYPWFNVTEYTKCIASSDAFYPCFLCKTIITKERLERIQNMVPRDKTISHLDLRSCAKQYQSQQ